MADVITGVTETSASAKAMIESLAQKYLIQESKMMPLVLNYSSMAVKGASSIKLPKAGGFTVGNKAENTGVDAQTSAFSVDTLSLNVHRVVQFLVEDIANQQASVDVVAEYLLRASKDLALDIDKKILDQLKTASASGPDHEINFTDATNEDIELQDILNARKLLMIQNIDPRECFMAIGPDQEANMLKIANFIEAEKYGSNSPILNGEIGMVYGMKVIVHSYLANEAVFWHPTAAAFALQQGVRVQKNYDLAQLASRYSLDYIGGFQVLDGGKRNVHITETA
jgi:N4-gp56 family major capsid protein